MVLTRQYDVALRYYRKLADEFGSAVCRDGKTGKQLFEQAAETAAIREAIERARPWPVGKAEISESQERTSQYISYRRVFACEERQRTGPVPDGLAVFYDQARNAVLIQDGNGNVILNVSLGNHRLAAPDFSPAHFRLCGHLLLVSMGMEVLAIDTLRAVGAVGKPADAILWRHDLVRPNITGNMYPHATAGSKTRPSLGPQSADVRQSAEGTGRRHRSAAGLRRVLPRGTDAGLRRSAHGRAHLVAGRDAQRRGRLRRRRVDLRAPPSGGSAQVFHALDGAEGEARPTEPLANRWATWGRHVLAWKAKTRPAMRRQRQAADNEADDEQLAQLPRELWLYDAVTGDEIWREQLPAGTRGTLVDCDEVALLQPDGRFVVRSLRGPEVLLEARLNADEKLRSVYVLRSRDQYLVATNHAAKSRRPTTRPSRSGRSPAAAKSRW